MAIKTTIALPKLTAIKANILVVPAYQPIELDPRLPASLQAYLKSEIKKVKFSGRWGAAEVFSAPPRFPFQLVAVVGLGTKKSVLASRLEGWRRGVARVVLEARHRTARNMAVLLPLEDTAYLASAGLEAITLADYRFFEHKAKLATEQKTRSLQRLTLLTDEDHVKDVKVAVKETQDILEGVSFTRDLVNQPASHVSPRKIVELAQQLAKKAKDVTCKVLDREQSAKAGFSAFLAVARGSEQEPYVIHLIYKPPQTAKKKIVLIGKGITFDSGGLSLKPAQYMESMKIDMAGAATVLGVFANISKLNLEVEVHGIIAACENMPSGNAYRPGDVLTSRSGRTIEILNTDAEGRVTLADALSYAVDLKPDAIIDIATLTGACIVALGDTYSGLWTNRPELRRQMLMAATYAGEGMVALPLPDELRPTIESKVADVRNTATINSGGAVTAALFLQEFVEDTPWIHLDVAGPVYAERPMIPYYAYGATGYGVRSVVKFLQAY